MSKEDWMDFFEAGAVVAVPIVIVAAAGIPLLLWLNAVLG